MNAGDVGKIPIGVYLIRTLAFPCPLDKLLARRYAQVAICLLQHNATLANRQPLFPQTPHNHFIVLTHKQVSG